MFAIFPLVCLVLICACFLIRGESGDEEAKTCRRDALLSGAIAWGVVLILGTELLGLLGLLTFGGVLGFWGLVAVVGGIVCGIRCVRLRPVAGLSLKLGRRAEIAPLAGLSLIFAALLGIVLIAPPNTWDSMTYHMARVSHWIQNRGVWHYPTQVQRQLCLAPGAEFAILHFQILSGGDRLASVPQWLSMLGGAVGVSLIARQLGASRRGQWLAALLAATVPMGILQGSSTQNDQIVALWIVCFCTYALRIVRGETRLPNFIAAASALGLALVTKGTAYLMAGPFLVWLLVSVARRLGPRGVGPVAVAATIVVAINVGHWSRNAATFGSLNGPTFGLQNDGVSGGMLLSNLARNTTLHLGSPSKWLNTEVYNAAASFHRWIGAGLEDPRTTWPTVRFGVLKPGRCESLDGNPLHFLLFFACGVVLLLSSKLRRRALAVKYLAAIGMSWVAFSALLRWQPWHSRLHLPLFVLGCASSALILDLSSRKGKRLLVVGVVVFSAALPYVLANRARSYVGERGILKVDRTRQYFRRHSALAVPYAEAVAFVERAGAANVGLVIGHDDWEYPFWVLLHDRPGRQRRIEHVGVENVSKGLSYPAGDFVPDVILYTRNEPKSILAIGGYRYALRFSKNPVRVFVRVTGSGGGRSQPGSMPVGASSAAGGGA